MVPATSVAGTILFLLPLSQAVKQCFNFETSFRHSFRPFSKSSGAIEIYFLPLAKVSFISNKLSEIFTISLRLAQETRVGKYKTILAPIRISPSVRSSFPLHLSIFANQIYKPTIKAMQHTIVPTQKMIDAIVPSTFSALSFCTLLLIVLSFVASWYTRYTCSDVFLDCAFFIPTVDLSFDQSSSASQKGHLVSWSLISYPHLGQYIVPIYITLIRVGCNF